MSSDQKGGDRVADQPEHSELCVCERCAPANRGALERLIASHDAWIDALDERGMR